MTRETVRRLRVELMAALLHNPERVEALRVQLEKHLRALAEHGLWSAEDKGETA